MGTRGFGDPRSRLKNDTVNKRGARIEDGSIVLTHNGGCKVELSRLSEERRVIHRCEIASESV